MEPSGRGAVIMKMIEARKAMPSMESEDDSDGGSGHGFDGMAKSHCQEGLKMTTDYLESEEGQSSALRPRVEALAAAYKDLLSALNEGSEEG